MTPFIRRHAIAILVVVMTVGFSTTAFVSIDQQSARRAEICLSFDDLQTVSRDLIDLVLDDGGGGGGVPLTAVPEFRALDPKTQAYLVALQTAAANSANPNALAERLATFRDDRLGPDDLPDFCT